MANKATDKCIKTVMSNERWPRAHQCNNRRKVGEYCTIHDPARIKAKRDAEDKAQVAERAKTDAIHANAERLGKLLGIEVCAYYNWSARKYTGELIVRAADLESLLERLI